MPSSIEFGRVALVVLLAGLPGAAVAQSTGPVIMRSDASSVFQIWVVDSETGLAAFYGGDIRAICRGEPDGWDLLDIQEAYDPQEIASMMVAQGQHIGASLWDDAPPFNPRLCQDILSRGDPMAEGTANVTATGRFPRSWADPDVRLVYGLTAQGTMTTPEGEILRVNSHWRCGGKGGETRCSEGIVVRPAR